MKPIYLYGTHAVKAALQNSDRRHQTLYGTREALEDIHTDVPTQTKARQELTALLGEDVAHQGLVLKTSPLKPSYLEDIVDQASTVMILDQITDPQNVGAILRSCAAFGVSALIQQERNAADPNHPVIGKNACGALERVPIVSVLNLSRAMNALQENGFWVIGLDERGEKDIQDIKLEEKTAFVMGTEGKGLRRLTSETCDELARLPTNPAFPTLNVSNATAITLYEWQRQNKK